MNTHQLNQVKEMEKEQALLEIDLYTRGQLQDQLSRELNMFSDLALRKQWQTILEALCIQINERYIRLAVAKVNIARSQDRIAASEGLSFMDQLRTTFYGAR